MENGRNKSFRLARIPRNAPDLETMGETVRPGEAGYLSVGGIHYIFAKVLRLLLTEEESDPLDPIGTRLGILPGQTNTGKGIELTITSQIKAIEDAIKTEQLGNELSEEEQLAALEVLEFNMQEDNLVLRILIRNVAGTSMIADLSQVSIYDGGGS